MTRDDGAALDEVHHGMSTRSRYARYFRPVDRMSDSMRGALLDIDGRRQVALVAEHASTRAQRAIGIARYVVVAPGRAEIAYEVVDAWQGRGVATRLVHELVATARRNGVEQVEASVLEENVASLAVLRRCLPQLRITPEPDALTVTARLIERDLDLDELVAQLTA
ncbi:GNAT family N-acetyltransferase [Nitriliruptor alkaliphilus]|uniref:GNAT family N-acetyltransferase n=1 Tax=Nitriliruptor alkaliphilus TaxID=427918 RepID=UPI0014706898|nr:GNAT family protein [Nitriliruptor alkaliphilus]